MDEQKQAVITRLEFYEKQFNELMKMLESRRPLRGPEKDESKDRLKTLKDDLKKEVADLYRNRDGLNDWERRYLEPALRQSSAHLTANASQTPSDQNWGGPLYHARGDITYVLFNLKQKDD